VIAYLLDGTSAEGQPGAPDGFASSLRHLTPALILALVLVPLAPAAGSRRGRIGLGALLGVLLIASDRSGKHWHSPYLLIADMAVIAALCIPLLRSADLPRLSPQLSRLRPRFSPRAASVAAIGLLLLGGWFLQRSYLTHRYDGSGFRSAGLDAAFKWARTLHEQRIATTVPIQYPLVGQDLSNHVNFLGRRRSDAGFTQISGCRRWRAALVAGGYGYVLTSGGFKPSESGKSHCLAGDPRAKPVLRVKQIVVFRLERPRVAGVREHPPGLERSESLRRRVERQRSSRS
jgi:hypothetical protein